MATLLKKIDKLIRDQLPGATIELDEFGPPPYIGGFVVWDGFGRLNDEQRSSRVRDAAKQGLTAEEFSRLDLILPLTTVEMCYRNESLARDAAEASAARVAKRPRRVS